MMLLAVLGFYAIKGILLLAMAWVAIRVLDFIGWLLG